MIDARGSAPRQSSLDGKLRWEQGLNQLKTNTTQIAVTPTAEGGDPADIQTAIDTLSENGGTIYLRNGTYLMEDSIVLASNVSIAGESSAAVIDFQNGNSRIIGQGELIYNVGTIAITNRSVTVTGTDTVWDTGMIGSTIYLNSTAYIILAVNSPTELEVESTFDGADATGLNYIIAEPLYNINVSSLTVQNSASVDGALYFQYVNFSRQTNLSIYDSTIGLNYVYCDGHRMTGTDIIGCGVGINGSHLGGWTFYDFFLYGCTTANMVLDYMISCSTANFTCSESDGRGIVLTNCSDMGIFDFTMNSNEGIGIEISDSTTLQLGGGNIRLGGSDGIKLTTGVDRIGMVNVHLLSNVGYGVNIANANCDKNTIGFCFFNSNTAGTINDLGTATISASNQT